VVRAPLPEGVDCGFAKLYSLTSSLTCVVLGFVFDQPLSGQYERILHAQYETEFKSLSRGGGYSISSPHSQKEHAINAIRRSIHDMAANWFKTHLPGVFSSGLLDGEFPCCELVKLEHAIPFGKREDRTGSTGQYLGILDFDLDLFAWELKEVPAVKFAWPPIRAREQRFHAVAAFNEKQFPEEPLKTWGGRERSSYIAYITERVSELLVRWSLIAILTGYENHLNALRDSLASIRAYYLH
jgi:hypothetical protein